MNDLNTVLSTNTMENWYAQSICLFHSPETHYISFYPHFIKYLLNTHKILVLLSIATRINTQLFSHTSYCGSVRIKNDRLGFYFILI